MHPAHKYDLIYSNAALHWLPDHGRLFPSLLEKVEPGGILAVQMPAQFRTPSHCDRGNRPERSMAQSTAHLVRHRRPGTCIFINSLLAPQSANIDYLGDGVPAVLEARTRQRMDQGHLADAISGRLQGQDKAASRLLTVERIAKAYPQNQRAKRFFRSGDCLWLLSARPDARLQPRRNSLVTSGLESSKIRLCNRHSACCRAFANRLRSSCSNNGCCHY